MYVCKCKENVWSQCGVCSIYCILRVLWLQVLLRLYTDSCIPNGTLSLFSCHSSQCGFGFIDKHCSNLLMWLSCPILLWQSIGDSLQSPQWAMSRQAYLQDFSGCVVCKAYIRFVRATCIVDGDVLHWCQTQDVHFVPWFQNGYGCLWPITGNVSQQT